MNSNKKRNKNKGRSKGKPKELSSAAISVRPGITNRYLQRCRFETDTYTTLLVDDLAIVADGSGIINTVIANDPTVTLNWASLKACFDEIRILAMEIDFKSIWVAGGSTTTFQTPILSVVDLDSNSALTSYDLGAQKGSAVEHRPQSNWKVEALMSGSGPGQFYSTSLGGTLNNMWIKFYSTGNTASMGVGRVTRRIVAQFRGKGN